MAWLCVTDSARDNARLPAVKYGFAVKVSCLDCRPCRSLCRAIWRVDEGDIECGARAARTWPGRRGGYGALSR
jgi:hypothetical protein